MTLFEQPNVTLIDELSAAFANHSDKGNGTNFPDLIENAVPLSAPNQYGRC